MDRKYINVGSKPSPDTDVVMDLEEYPWVFPDNCCDLLIASQIVEHIEPHKGGFLKFMDECWRIVKPDGEMMISTPYAGTMGYYQDPTHCNPCNEVTFYYFDPLQSIDGKDLYKIYKPKPWHIKNIAWTADGNIEVLISKRRWDKSYDKA